MICDTAAEFLKMVDFVQPQLYNNGCQNRKGSLKMCNQTNTLKLYSAII